MARSGLWILFGFSELGARGVTSPSMYFVAAEGRPAGLRCVMFSVIEGSCDSEPCFSLCSRYSGIYCTGF